MEIIEKKYEDLKNFFDSKKFFDLHTLYLMQRNYFLVLVIGISMFILRFLVFLNKSGIELWICLILFLIMLVFSFFILPNKFEIYPIWIKDIVELFFKKENITYSVNGDNISEDIEILSEKYPGFIKSFKNGIFYKFDGIKLIDKEFNLELSYMFYNTRKISKYRYSDIEKFELITITGGEENLSKILEVSDFVLLTSYLLKKEQFKKDYSILKNNRFGQFVLRILDENKGSQLLIEKDKVYLKLPVKPIFLFSKKIYLFKPDNIKLIFYKYIDKLYFLKRFLNYQRKK